MTGERSRRAIAAAALALAILATGAVALAAPAGVERERLSGELRDAEELLTYDSSRMLVISPFGSIARVDANGSLDRSFGDEGWVKTRFSDVLVAPGGKLLLAGSGERSDRPGNSDATVTRLLADGRPDRSFGDQGVAHVDFGGRYDGAAALAVDARGRIVVGGAKQTYLAERGGDDASPVVARLFANGTLDRAFGNKGLRHLSSGGESGVRDLGLDESGAIVAEGEAYIGTAIWRLSESGEVDRHFGNKGEVTIEGRDRRGNDWAETLGLVDRIGVRADGKIVIAGTGSTYGDGTNYRLVALRLRRDGRLDRGYGHRGYATAQFAGWTFVGSVTMLPGGGLVAATSAQGVHEKRSDVGLIALDGRGRLNPRLLPRGKTTVHLPGWAGAQDVALQKGRATVLADTSSPRGNWLLRVPLG